MPTFVTEDDMIATVPRLSRQRLDVFVKAEILAPVHSETGPVFRKIDRARARLACDLVEDFDLHTDALSMMLSLLDQLHGVRAELKAVLRALEHEPEDRRQRIAEAILAARTMR